MGDGPTGPLTGQTVAITGAAGGIGRALAHRFARAGARVGLLDRDASGAAAAAQDIRNTGAEARAMECDVTSWDACQATIHTLEDAFGGIDVLINNAGITHVSRFADTDPTVIRRVMEVNFFGAVYCTKAALPAVRARQGSIVAISSVAGFSPLAGRCGYSASKHALHGLFDTLRAEERQTGVHVMLVCPTFTRTGIEDHALGAQGGRLETKRTVYGQIAEPADVAEAIYSGLRSRRRLLVLGRVGKLSYLLSRAAPTTYERIMVRRMLPD